MEREAGRGGWCGGSHPFGYDVDPHLVDDTLFDRVQALPSERGEDCSKRAFATWRGTGGSRPGAIGALGRSRTTPPQDSSAGAAPEVALISRLSASGIHGQQELGRFRSCGVVRGSWWLSVPSRRLRIVQGRDLRGAFARSCGRRMSSSPGSACLSSSCLRPRDGWTPTAGHGLVRAGRGA
jgi:hypothetical protein